MHMQGNFEKLTREELVILEAENVLQPAAIQKVLMVIVMMLRMMVMLIMAYTQNSYGGYSYS